MNHFLKFVAAFPVLAYIVISPSVYGTSIDQDGKLFMDSGMQPNNIFSNIFNFSSISQKNVTLPQQGLLNIVTSFVNQTRQTIPNIVHIGNFTLIQAALLFAIGSMAAGAATIALEALIFRQRETEIERYKNRFNNHRSDQAEIAAMVYDDPYNGRPASIYYDPYSGYSSYNSSYSAASSYPKVRSHGVNSSRKKRDTEQTIIGHYPQVVSPYNNRINSRRKHYNKNINNGGPLTFQDSSHKQSHYFQGNPNLGSENNRNGNHRHPSEFQNFYEARYPDSSDILMMNRLGMKKKHNSKRKISSNGMNFDDDMEYARGISINDSNDKFRKKNSKFGETEQLRTYRSHLHNRKHYYDDYYQYTNRRPHKYSKRISHHKKTKL